jgi:hypothetical protein
MPQFTPLAKVTEIIVHHSDSARDTTTFEEIRQWHLEKGWIDIGYHGVILSDGSFHVGRPDNVMGAQALNHNFDSLGFCVTGNFEVETPTEAQIHTLIQVLAAKCKAHNVPAKAIKGHRDVDDTSCPGKNLYAMLPHIREEVAKYL